MGFYIGKSLRAGPFRFNVSTLGLGVSVGVPGFRVGTGPRGNYVRIGAGGVYYRASLNGRGFSARRHVPGPVIPLAQSGSGAPPAPEILMQGTTGVTVEQLLPTTADDLVTQLNDAAKRVFLWPYATVAAVIAAIALGSTFGILLLVLAIPGIVWLYLRDCARRSVVAFYEVDGPQARWFEQVVDALRGLGQCAAVWRINAAGDVTTTHQYKVNAGASTIISRDRVSITSKGPKILVTNIVVPGIEVGRHTLHFLPDRLLVRDGRRFATVRYEDLRVAQELTRFIEDGSVPRDARQVGATWRYVNIKGGPDRRFNNNAQLPVMLYARLMLATAAGLLWIIDTSVTGAGEQVARVLADARSPTVLDAPVTAQLSTPAGNSVV